MLWCKMFRPPQTKISLVGTNAEKWSRINGLTLNPNSTIPRNPFRSVRLLFFGHEHVNW